LTDKGSVKNTYQKSSSEPSFTIKRPGETVMETLINTLQTHTHTLIHPVASHKGPEGE